MPGRPPGALIVTFSGTRPEHDLSPRNQCSGRLSERNMSTLSRRQRALAVIAAEWNGAGEVCPECHRNAQEAHWYSCPRKGSNAAERLEREAAAIRRALADNVEVTDRDRWEFAQTQKSGT
jgi:DNA repair exonuclease SbcCD ATPase subunit